MQVQLNVYLRKEPKIFESQDLFLKRLSVLTLAVKNSNDAILSAVSKAVFLLYAGFSVAVVLESEYRLFIFMYFGSDIISTM